jgi:Arc/MetJ-type ribon-helix-helix transcriptional regulator
MKGVLMDDIEKSRVRLIHWIEHNVEHLKGYNEVAQILERDGFASASDSIRRGVSLIEAANEQFGVALAGLSPPTGEASASDSEAERGHAHEHEHGHEHAHKH